MNPYYSHQDITIYHGDSREIVPTLGTFDACITDPVWPNATADLPGKEDPFGLLRDVAAHLPGRCRRMVVQLGCDSDPRFLSAVPPELSFLRACWLEYSCPHYKGRLLYTSDLAYVFGEWPTSEPGAHVLPGRSIYTPSGKQPRLHPSPRKLAHLQWLVRWFAQGPVLDPFMGSGTTALACHKAGLPFVGVEIEERFCEAAVKRLCQQNLPWEWEENEISQEGIAPPAVKR